MSRFTWNTTGIAGTSVLLISLSRELRKGRETQVKLWECLYPSLILKFLHNNIYLKEI